jgi:predicted LPLAT superfamily acyltransferase
MDHMWTRLITQLAARVSGPMKFRMVLQPAMAAFFAIRSGLADARVGKSPYFWALVTEPAQRKDLIKDGWKSVGRVFILALLLDVVYQIIILHFVYIGETIIVAFVLAIVPYLILRGLVTRLAGRNYARRQHGRQTPLHSS